MKRKAAGGDKKKTAGGQAKKGKPTSSPATKAGGGQQQTKKRKYSAGLTAPPGLASAAGKKAGKGQEKRKRTQQEKGQEDRPSQAQQQKKKRAEKTRKAGTPAAVAEVGAAYAGWVPTQRRGSAVATEDVSKWSVGDAAERLWRSYVAARRPVVLRGAGAHGLLGPEWRAASEWSLAYLRERAGECAVKVERRDSSRGRFGEGHEVRTTFGEFLRGLESGDDLHYMTTQDIVRDADGRPEIIAPPLTHLRSDFPMRPPLMGNLVPANINLWMGNSREGSISGLHHDFHDNLYILLKGHKRFALLPPSDAGRMYVQGQIVKVHPNGLITYQEGVRSDGADVTVEAAVAAEEEHTRAEEELAAAEAAVERGELGAEERLRAAEEALETAMEAVLSAQVAGDDDDEDGEGDVFDGVDDFDDWEDDDDQPENQSAKPKEKKGKAGAENEETEMVRKKDSDGTVLPQNFSKIDMSVPTPEREKRWPLMKEASMIECEVRAGEMLFLPAGWFHNVTSFSDNDEGLHMAFNYWFHPPDASSFEQPYVSDFWLRDWDARLSSANNVEAPGKKKKTRDAAPSSNAQPQQPRTKRRRGDKRRRRSAKMSS